MPINTSNGDVTSIPRMLQLTDSPATITVKPDVGTTALVEFSTTSFSDIRKGQAIWQPWPAGTVSTLTTDALLSPISAIKISRPSGSGNVHWEINQ